MWWCNDRDIYVCIERGEMFCREICRWERRCARTFTHDLEEAVQLVLRLEVPPQNPCNPLFDFSCQLSYKGTWIFSKGCKTFLKRRKMVLSWYDIVLPYEGKSTIWLMFIIILMLLGKVVALGRLVECEMSLLPVGRFGLDLGRLLLVHE